MSETSSALVAAMMAVLVSACSSGEPVETTFPAPATTEAMAEATVAEETVPETTIAAATDTATITMAGLAFSGAQTVEVGQTIELVNSDDAPHTWTAEDGSFDVAIGPGATVTYSFDTPGEFAYFCEIHPSMTGTIRVEE